MPSQERMLMNVHQSLAAQFEWPRGTFGRIAGWVMAHRSSNRERNSWTVELLAPQSEDHILEIGCGPGLGLKACLERATNGLVVGLDHSLIMLHQAGVRNRQAVQEGRLELHLGNLHKLPYADGYFDKIFSVNVVQFLEDRAGVFEMLRGKLRSGGQIATTYMPRGQKPGRKKAFAMADEICRHMEAVGFVRIRIEELLLKPVPAVCVLGERS